MSPLLRSGVGSLPHRDIDEAVAFVLASSDIPYLPQLPNRHPAESMLAQWGDGILGAGAKGRLLQAGAAGGAGDEAHRGGEAMVAALQGGTIKTQATGPVTLAAALRSGGVIAADLLTKTTAELVTRIATHVAWIRVRAAPERLVVILDEPALAAFANTGLPPEAGHAIKEVFAAIDAEVGIHCCGESDWAGVAALGPAWISWDVAALGRGFHTGAGAIAEAIAAGTGVMWGVIPTTAGPLPERNVLQRRYGTALAELIVAGAPLAALRDDAWFTPACGLAGLSVGDATAVVEALSELVEEIVNGW